MQTPPLRDVLRALTGALVTVRPGDESDAEALLEILAEPSVAAWWGERESAPQLVAKLRGTPDTVLLVIEVEGEVAGGIEVWEEQDPDYRHAGLDVYLARRFQDRGLGTEALGLVARYLFDVRGHHRLTIDPAADNARAIRSYEKAGFRTVGVMRDYERRADGRFHDGLLMEMLRGELAR